MPAASEPRAQGAGSGPARKKALCRPTTTSGEHRSSTPGTACLSVETAAHRRRSPWNMLPIVHPAMLVRTRLELERRDHARPIDEREIQLLRQAWDVHQGPSVRETEMSRASDGWAPHAFDNRNRAGRDLQSSHIERNSQECSTQ